MHKIFKTILIATVLLSGTFLIHSQPEPGDVYKEFTFIPESGSFSLGCKKLSIQFFSGTDSIAQYLKEVK